MAEAKSKLGNPNLDLYWIDTFTYYIFSSYDNKNKTLKCKLATNPSGEEVEISLVKG
jgi:hypothetical protein